MNRKKKLFSLLLVVAMIVTAVSTNVFSAFAEESVDLSQFIDKNLPSDVVDRSYIKMVPYFTAEYRKQNTVWFSNFYQTSMGIYW